MTDPLMLDMPEEDAASGGNFLALLPIILWQRKWLIIVPAVIGIVGAIAAVLLIPPTYQAKAIMLVESPELPAALIELETSDLIDRRMASIKQQVTARPDLIALIEQNGLYISERKSKPLSEVIEEMRSSITLTATQASGAKGGNQSQTIAFELAFEYSEPVKTQAVAQSLMDRVLQLDARGNVEQATNTAQFLTDQSTGLEKQIAELQGQIASINAANGGVLANVGPMYSGNTGSYDVQIAALVRDNQSLTQQRSLAQNSDTRDPGVAAAEQRLSAVSAVYAETHPDVVIAKQALAQARELAKSNNTKIPFDALERQIEFNNSQIAALRQSKESEIGMMNSRMAAQSRSPLIQQQLGELQQRLSTLNEQYAAVQNRLMAARAGVRAEDQQMAERLSVVEPPIVPDQPSWPDRLIVAAIGIGGGLGLGILLAFAVELIMRPIRDPSALKAIIGMQPLGIVPLIGAKVAHNKQAGWRKFSLARRKAA